MSVPDLREYQTRCVAEVRQHYAEFIKRVLLVSPTGSGKTIMFSWLMDRSAKRRKRGLILLHRIELAEQTLQTLAAFGVDAGFIGPDAGNPRQKHVMVAMVQTLARRLDYWRDRFDFLVIDEAHHAVATQYRQVIDSQPNAYLLGVTATPERLDGRGLGDVFERMVLGPQVRDLIGAGYLAEYQFQTSPTGGPDLSKVKTSMGDFDMGALADAMGKSAITGNAIAEYRKHCQGAPTVAFCVSVAHAEAVAQAFRDAGYAAVSVDGSTEKDERRRRIRGLGDGSVQVLTSCSLISEGVDVPGIVGVVNLRPSQSRAMVMQQWGRALRPKKGGQHAILLDHAGHFHRHGLPCDRIEWSLYSEKRKANAPKPLITARLCPACFLAVPAGPLVCPGCGQPYPKKDRLPPKQQDGELVDAKKLERKPALTLTPEELKRAIERCRTWPDVKALATAIGKPHTWAFMTFKHKVKDRGPVAPTVNRVELDLVLSSKLRRHGLST